MTENSVIPDRCRNPKSANEFLEWATMETESNQSSFGSYLTSGSIAYTTINILAGKCEKLQYEVELLETKIEKIRSQQDYFRQKAREGEAVPGLNRIIVDQAAKIAELGKDLHIARKINFPE